ncbi:S1C family serine protease [Microaerobacter geothermalis]|uniref:S1C family serine protease n=1 Tax=Microaerobacter geothermalis TaxID=674972 RepID=UPI001F15C843|nr:S1C family serine protease [Microaerobacter geothermalis]MCF6094646.1 S1C family serine protease [Microaerobacter geothermalis]
MPFFDDDFFEEEFPNRPRRKRGFFSAILGSIIGGTIVLFSIPLLYQLGWVNLPIMQTPIQKDVPPDPVQPGSGNATPESSRIYRLTVESAVIDAVAKMEEAVVGVVNIQKQENFWSGGTSVEAGTGSGVIFDIKGDKALIVTNFHVIEGYNKVEVALITGERISAKVIGFDYYTDLAVLEIDSAYAKAVAQFGDSTTLKVGEPAIAIGNPLGLEFSRTVTMGIISAKERTVPRDINNDGQPEWELEVIQTDAAINPGNSGGALINIDGQLIGINSIKIMEKGVEGLGFAIPINDVKPIIDDIVAFGEPQRALMGIEPVDLSLYSNDELKKLELPKNVTQGVLVRSVTPQGPAYQGGLQNLDVITKLDETPVYNSAQLRKYLYKEKNPGDKIKVTFYRQGQLMTTEIILGKLQMIP